ncbi:MAG: hypothetical protein ACE5JB_12560 [bacterium]
MKFTDLGFPEEIVQRLIKLKLFVDHPVKFLTEGHSFLEILEEITTAINHYGESIPNYPSSLEITGPCWIHPSVRIKFGSIIAGPCLISADCDIGPNCYLKPGTVLGQRVKVGFGAEVNKSIIGNDTKIVHRAYIGNSLIGNLCEISAGVVISNKRFDERPIRTWTEDGNALQTSLKKLGAFVGDYTRLGAGAIVLPGTRIREQCRIWPNAIASGFIKSHSEIKKNPVH